MVLLGLGCMINSLNRIIPAHLNTWRSFFVKKIVSSRTENVKRFEHDLLDETEGIIESELGRKVGDSGFFSNIR